MWFQFCSSLKIWYFKIPSGVSYIIIWSGTDGFHQAELEMIEAPRHSLVKYSITTHRLYCVRYSGNWSKSDFSQFFFKNFVLLHKANASSTNTTHAIFLYSKSRESIRSTVLIEIVYVPKLYIYIYIFTHQHVCSKMYTFSYTSTVVCYQINWSYFTYIRTEIMTWISNYIHTFLNNVITQTCPNLNGGIVKHPFGLRHVWVITSHHLCRCDYLSIPKTRCLSIKCLLLKEQRFTFKGTKCFGYQLTVLCPIPIRCFLHKGHAEYIISLKRDIHHIQDTKLTSSYATSFSWCKFAPNHITIYMHCLYDNAQFHEIKVT